MADRKSRTVTFKTPINVSIKEIRDAIKSEIGPDQLTVFQQLVETTTPASAENLIDSGFECKELHVACHPPKGYLTNVSIMGFRAYIEDTDITAVLSQYG